MSDKVIIPPHISPVSPIGNQPSRTQVQSPGPRFGEVFQDALTDATEVKFSAHALKRLETRQIKLGTAEMNLLRDAVDRAEAKGARESLILLDKLALVVSVKNRTVITAVDESSLKENVFTNIDSAVIVK